MKPFGIKRYYYRIISSKISFSKQNFPLLRAKAQIKAQSWTRKQKQQKRYFTPLSFGIAKSFLIYSLSNFMVRINSSKS